MTMNYLIEELECTVIKHLAKEKKVVLNIDWVSDGTYSINSYKPYHNQTDSVYISLEGPFFDQIIEKFEQSSPVKKLNEVFKPIWSGCILPRGMMLGPENLNVYRDQDWLALHGHAACGSLPMAHIAELILKFDDFKKIRDIALNSKQERIIHYVRF